ncbi:Sds3-like protein [Gongronella butleri]|nr:Sds3-like protein [Gongronella butleri]
MLRRLREYNDVMSWMDSDFWDHHEQLYEEKLQTLQKELQSIQDGEHPLFKELVTDLELIRDQAIDDALCFEAYQLSMSRQDHDVNTMLIEEECQTEIDHLNEVLMVVIDEHRKMIKEDRDDIDGIEISNIFTEAYARVKQKRHLRKRAANHNNVDRGSPARVENRGRRQKNAPVVHSIHAPLTTKEEDEVESDLLMMKGVSTKRGAPARR